MPSLSSKEACAGISQCQLTNTQTSTGSRKESACNGDSSKVIEAASELSLHLMFSQAASQNKMQSIIHPSEIFAVTKEFHYKCRRSEDGHAGNELSLGDELVEGSEEKSKACMDNFSGKIKMVSVL